MSVAGRGKRRPALADPNAGQSAFGSRLRLLASHWPSAERLARAAGVSPSAFRKWIRGEAEPSRDRLIALSETAGVSIEWLVLGHGPDPKPRARVSGSRTASEPGEESGAVSTEFLYLPNAPEAAAAGGGEVAPGPARRFIGFRTDWIKHALDAEARTIELETAIGDSMEPGIRNGDILLIDTRDPRITEFGIYVLELHGERIVKRVQRRFDGSVVLISDNPHYLAEELAVGMVEEIRVVGRVVWRGGPV